MTASYSCLAIAAPGLEALAASELAGIGVAPERTEAGGVEFAATAAQLYAANLELRTASRVVVRIASFPARAFYELERKARRVPWERFLGAGVAVRFRVASRKSRLYHQDAVAERLLGVVAGQPPGTPDDPEDDEGHGVQLVLVRIVRDMVTISMDSSGALLHRRGYRLATGKAPLRETMAAAMLLSAGYVGTRPLCDPFAGSGTIPIEAALMARAIAPGLRRSFAFERWPEHNGSAWRTLRSAAEDRIRPRAPAPILGSDRDAGAVAAARANAERAGVSGDVEFLHRAVSDLVPPPGPGFVVTNPPYGIRVSPGPELRDLHARLGAVLREQCAGWRVALLSADPVLDRAARLPLTPAWASENGGIPVRCLVGAVS